MRKLRIGNYTVETPLIEIIRRLQLILTNGKLKDVEEKGDNILVTCPVHDDGLESKPACNVYIGDNLDIEYGYFRCFVCEAQGSFVKFVAECFNSSEAFAKTWLISHYGIKSYEGIQLADAIQINKQTVVKKKSMATNLNSYQSYCPYLAKRKLSRATCERFNVKYDPKYRQVIFPCYDMKGNLVMTPTRSIDFKVFHLDKDVEKPVYCLNEIMKNNIKKAIITEGPFDCLTGWEYGIPTVATLGTPSDYQISQLNKSCLEVIYTMFDNDKAGRDFTAKLNHALSKRIVVINVQIPAGRKDINDLSKEEFENLFKNYKNF